MKSLYEEKEDVRIIRSKRDLANALDELLSKKNYDDISIQEIVNTALVSKNTFYNNFNDKDELLMFLFTRYSLEVYKKVEKYLNDDSYSYNEVIKILLNEIIDFFENNKDKFKNMIINDRSKALYWNLNNFIKELTEFIFNTYKDKIPLDIDITLFSPFLSGGISNLIYTNFLNDSLKSKEEIFSYLEKMINIKFNN